MVSAERLIELDDIHAARRVIAGKVLRTPMMQSDTLGKMLGVDLHFKMELFQKTGSFKVRGALNKLNSLSPDEKQRGVIAISAGNHAAGLACAAAHFGVEATIVMPESAPHGKVEATESYGGKVVLHGEMKDIMPKANALQAERNLTFVHPFDDPYVIAGQGTIGLEILEDMPEPDIVIVPVGGGGLISGVAAAIKIQRPNTRIIGVEPTGSSALTQSLSQKRVIHIEHNETFADGLKAPFAGEHTLAHMQRYVDEMVLVSDEEIMQALWMLMERCKVILEGAGAAAFAALYSRKFDVPTGASVVCMVSGGNIDRERLKSIL